MSALLKVSGSLKQQQFLTNLYQWDACGRGFSDTRTVFHLPFDFCLWIRLLHHRKKIMYSHTFSGLTFRGSLQSRTPFLLQIFIKRRYVYSN